MKWTLPGICYYLIWFFAVGTTACTATTTNQIGRSQFELLAQNESKDSKSTFRVIHTLEKKRMTISSSDGLYVDRIKTDSELGVQTKMKRRVIPLAFSIDKDLVTPIPEKHPKGLRSPFTLTPNDEFEVRTSEFSLGRSILLFSFYVSILIFEASGFL